jgi:hypothetical protein
MSSIITKHTTTMLALALALTAAPAVALAAPHGEARPGAAARAGDPYPDEDAAGQQAGHKRFPMEAKRFLDVVEKRLGRFEQRVERRLRKGKLPAELERDIRAEIARGEAQVRDAARKAAADGQVTKDEAWQVRELATELQEQAKAKYGPKVRAARHQQAEQRPKRG